MNTDQEIKAVTMALTAAIREDRVLGGIIKKLNKQDCYCAAGCFSGSLRDGILVPKKLSHRAVTVMTRTLIDNGILPKGSFEITPSYDQTPFALTPAGEVDLVPVAVKIRDLSMVNIPCVQRFLKDVEDTPAITESTRHLWN